MPRPSPLPDSLTGRPFTVVEARRSGVSRQRTRASDLVAPFHGVRAPVNSGGLTARCASYLLRMPAGHVFSHATAATLYGMPLPRRLEQSPQLHVSVPRGDFPPQARSVRGHVSALAANSRMLGGLPLVAPAVALLQLADTLGHRDLVRCGDFLVRR